MAGTGKSIQDRKFRRVAMQVSDRPFSGTAEYGVPKWILQAPEPGCALPTVCYIDGALRAASEVARDHRVSVREVIKDQNLV